MKEQIVNLQHKQLECLSRIAERWLRKHIAFVEGMSQWGLVGTRCCITSEPLQRKHHANRTVNQKLTRWYKNRSNSRIHEIQMLPNSQLVRSIDPQLLPNMRRTPDQKGELCLKVSCSCSTQTVLTSTSAPMLSCHTTLQHYAWPCK